MSRRAVDPHDLPFEERQRIDREHEQRRRRWLRDVPYTQRLGRGQPDHDDDLTDRGWAAARRYWVCADTRTGLMASWFGWVYGPGETPPPPVPNRSMQWRRPTYAEALHRQQMYDADAARFFDLVTEYAGRRTRR